MGVLRNGIPVHSIDCNGVNLPKDPTKSQSLALCLALRRSSACASLLPGPVLLLEQDMNTSEGCHSEIALEVFEESAARVIFETIDVSGDGALDRQEIASVLGGTRSDTFDALDTSKDGKVSFKEWESYCKRVKFVRGPSGLGLFLDAFRKKLIHIGRNISLPDY